MAKPGKKKKVLFVLEIITLPLKKMHGQKRSQKWHLLTLHL